MLAHNQALLAIRERLGVAGVEEITNVRLAQTYDDLAKAGVKSAEDRATAERIVRREAIETAKAIEVRASSLPGLTKLGQDAADTAKQFDKLGTDSIANLNSSLLDFETGAKSGAEAFKDLEKQVIRSLLNMLNQMLIVAPIAQALRSLFGFVPGVGSSGPLNLLPSGIGHNAGGTDNWRGGLSWVGERGPELLNVPRGAQIIPNTRSAAAAPM